MCFYYYMWKYVKSLCQKGWIDVTHNILSWMMIKIQGWILQKCRQILNACNLHRKRLLCSVTLMNEWKQGDRVLKMIVSFRTPRFNVSDNFGEQLLRKIAVLHIWFQFNPTHVHTWKRNKYLNMISLIIYYEWFLKINEEYKVKMFEYGTDYYLIQSRVNSGKNVAEKRKVVKKITWKLEWLKKRKVQVIYEKY